MKASLIAAALALTLPVVAAAAPITEAEAMVTAENLVAEVGVYSARHPEAAGAFAPWAADRPAAGTPILIHSYPALGPSYYYVPLTPTQGGPATYVTVGAVEGEWQAFGVQSERAAFPEIARTEAARLASSELGADVAATDLRAVSMPNKHIYWYWRENEIPGLPGRELFINVSDRTDVHHALDAQIAPPEPPLDLPPENAVRSDGHQAIGRATRFPSSYDIANVPYHVQGTAYNCGPAASEMVMDYYGPDINQEDIADVANCTAASGSDATDVRRSGHFSSNSSSIQNPYLNGYRERKLGYGALTAWWSNPDASDPDYPDRYNDLKEIISQDFPVLVLTWYDTSQSSGHFRVVKGYNDITNVFIVHDPWYGPPYQGPDVNFNQTTFVDDLWTKWNRWGTLICPWEVDVSAPFAVRQGDVFTVAAGISYHGPHPFEGQDPASSRFAVIDTTGSFGVVIGQFPWITLPASATSASADTVAWDVTTNAVNTSIIIEVMARGLITDSSFSYTSYSDSIGGKGYVGVTVWSPTYTFVDPGGGGDFLTIQEGLDYATHGDTVCVLPGIYGGTGNTDIHFDGKAVTLMSACGPSQTVIDCEGSSRAFALTDGEEGSTVIDGFTVRNGAAQGTPWPDDSGGGMLLVGSSPTIRNVVFEDNWAEYVGGGICCADGASPEIIDCDLIGNTAGEGGGGMACANGSSPSLSQVKFLDNWGGMYGGGLWCDLYSDATLAHCTFARNSAPDDGGAVLFTRDTGAVVTNCTLVENWSSVSGGIACYDSSPEVTNTIIAFSPDGSGVTCQDGGAPVFTHCCVYGNASSDSLCGIHVGQGNIYDDPLLCDESDGAYYLEECSPCAGAGVGRTDIGAWGVGCECGDPTGVEEEPLPSGLALHPPRPSPFGDATTLDLDVPEGAGRVTLAVYNVGGRLVRTLADGAVRPGRREFVWNGTDDTGYPVSAGVYFARCTSGSQADTRKIVLLR